MNRTTLIAIGVFVLLLLGVLATQPGEPERGIQRVSFTSIDQDQIDAVEIGGQNPVTLTKADGQWKVESFGKDADSSIISRSLDQVVKVSSSDLVTESEERYEKLGVTDEAGVDVKVSVGGKVAAEFIVGNGAPGGSYLRVGEQVFTVKGIYKGTFDRDPDKWLDRRLFRGRRADELEKVEIAVEGQTAFTLEMKDGAWALPDSVVTPEGFRFDASMARNVTSTMTNLRAREIVLDPLVGDTGLGEGADAFTLTFGKGDHGEAGATVLRLGGSVPKDEDSKDPAQVYAMVDARPDEVVTILESQASSLRRGLDALRDLKVMEFDVDKAVKLSVRGEERVELEKKDGAWALVSHSEEKPAGFELDPAAVMRRIRAIRNARAAKVQPDTTMASAGLTRPSATVTVTLEDGSSAVLKFGSEFKDENERDHVYLAGNVDGFVYAATSFLKNNTAGGLDGFEKQAAPAGGAMGGIDPSQLQNLPPEVRKSLEQQMAQQAQQQRMIEQLKAKNP